MSKSKRIEKKHEWHGSKRAGTYYCMNIIGNGIRRRYIDATDEEPSVKNIKQYLRWFYHNSSQKEWDDCVSKHTISYQMMFSAKHLLPTQPDDGPLAERYRNKSVIDEIKETVEKWKRER